MITLRIRYPTFANAIAAANLCLHLRRYSVLTQHIDRVETKLPLLSPRRRENREALILPLLGSDLAGIDEMICQFWHVISHHSTLSSFMCNKMPLGVFIARSRYRQHTEEIYMGKWKYLQRFENHVQYEGIVLITSDIVTVWHKLPILVAFLATSLRPIQPKSTLNVRTVETTSNS